LATHPYLTGSPLVKQITTVKDKADSDPHTVLSSIGEIQTFQKKNKIFNQGDLSDSLFFIRKGQIRLSVVSEEGREATLGILSEGDYFGEGGLAGQLRRASSAVAITPCILLHIERKAMMLAMSEEPKLSNLFVEYLLRRHIRYQDDLVDQIFNSSEKRLARVLLLMAPFGKEGGSAITVPRLSQETLAEMVGTTRSRVSFFMNRFRKLGFISYDVGDKIHVNSSLLNIVLPETSFFRTTTGERESEREAAAEVVVEASATPEELLEEELPEKDRTKRPSPASLKHRSTAGTAG
jgi:CRP/FNR family cyclic AMP-dependent transcriptional regulator